MAQIWSYGDNVNTDQLFPGKYTYSCSKAEEIMPHLLEDLDSNFAKKVKKNDLIFAGKNFGCGSSREQPALGLKHAGIQAIIAKSFARIFFRASINQGLVLIECPAAVDGYKVGDSVEIDVLKGKIIISGKEYIFPGLPKELLDIRDAGGLLSSSESKILSKKQQYLFTNSNQESSISSRPKTLVQKILARKAGLSDVNVGQIVTVTPDHILSHDNTAAIVDKIKKSLDKYYEKYTEMYKIDNEFPIIVLDHIVPSCMEKGAQGHVKIREFVNKHNIKHFYDIGEGVCHQIVMEKALALPGSLIVGSDSHTCSYGAIGCFSTGIDRTEAASLLLTKQLWLRVPPTIKVNLSGKLQPNVYAKDLVLHLCKLLTSSGAAYSTLEFHGEGISNLTIDERFTISNMGVEMDSKGAVFPVDDITLQYLTERGVKKESINTSYADKDADYIREVSINMSEIQPMIAKPHHVDNVYPVNTEGLLGLKVDQCFIGTCTNGRHSDLKIAADIVRGKHIASGCRLLICPASRVELLKAIFDSSISSLLEAGAVLLPVGCGPCLGAHQGVLAPNEVCLSTANRNFKGRMGCNQAFIYLASPAVVACSALYGVITDPRK